MQRKIYSRVDYLGLEQKVVSLQGDIESLASSIPKAQAAAEEAKQRLTLRKAEWKRKSTPKWACCNRSMSSARAKSKN